MFYLQIGKLFECVQICGVVQTSSSSPQVIVFPNPASNFLNVSLSQTFNSPKLELYDVQDRKVFSALLKQSDLLDVSNLKSGIYLYILKDGKEFKFTGKIIKQ